MATVIHEIKNAEFEAKHHRGFHGRFGSGTGVTKPKLLVRDQRAVTDVASRFSPHPITAPAHAAQFAHAHPGGALHPDTVGAFHELAGKLRRGDSSDPRIAEIDKAMHPTERDVMLSRHVSAAAFGLRDDELDQLVATLAGRKIVDRAYTPAALHQPDQAGGVMLHIAVPAGTRAAVAGDNEMWLDRDVELAVRGVHPNGQGGYTVELMALPKAAPAKKATKAAAKKAAAAAGAGRGEELQARRAHADDIRTFAQHAAEVEELAANGASHDILKERAATMHPDIREAVERSTPGQVSSRVRRLAAGRGLHAVGRAGHVDKLDRSTMNTVGDSSAANGADVVVVRPGYVYDAGDGPVVAHKAQVVTYQPGEFRVGQRGRVLGPAKKAAPAKKTAPTKATTPKAEKATPAKKTSPAAKTNPAAKATPAKAQPSAPEPTSDRKAPATQPYIGPAWTMPEKVDSKQVAELRDRIKGSMYTTMRGAAAQRIEHDPETKQLARELGPAVATRLAWESDAQAAIDRLALYARPDDPTIGPYDEAPPITEAERAAAQTKAAEILREEWRGKKIATRITASTLKAVLDEGRFKTQFETGRSAGGFGTTRRAAAEQMMFGIPKNADPKTRPFYGYLAMDGVDAAHEDDLLNTYGDIQVVFKDSVRSRTTASVGDTLDQEILPSPVNDPQWYSFNPTAHDYKAAPKDYARSRSILYVEAQIHGGVGVSDIEEVAFSKPPSKALQQQLERLGISWRLLTP